MRFPRLRRTPHAHRGWQDFELGTYVTDPAPAPTSQPSVGYLDILPDLLPFQREMLRTWSMDVRNRMRQAYLNPEDARISIHHQRKVDGLTVFGIPVRLDPRVPPDEVFVEITDDFPRPCILGPACPVHGVRT